MQEHECTTVQGASRRGTPTRTLETTKLVKGAEVIVNVPAGQAEGPTAHLGSLAHFQSIFKAMSKWMLRNSSWCKEICHALDGTRIVKAWILKESSEEKRSSKF